MNMFRIVLPVAAILVAAPAIAQPPTAQHQHDQPAAPSDQAAMHERCKAMMGAKMAGRPAHEHSADKQGIAAGKRKPPTAAEMDQMHKRCAEMMAKAEAPAKK